MPYDHAGFQIGGRSANEAIGGRIRWSSTREDCLEAIRSALAFFEGSTRPEGNADPMVLAVVVRRNTPPQWVCRRVHFKRLRLNIVGEHRLEEGDRRS